MTLIKVYFVILFSFSALASSGGDGAGNGGISVVCREEGKIKNITLLDIYEGENIYRKEFDKTLVRSEILSVIEARLENYILLKNRFLKEFYAIEKRVDFISKHYDLVLTDDAFKYLKPSLNQFLDCNFEQLAIYTKEDRLLVSKERYDYLSEFDKVGLIVHEAIYLILRAYGAENSIDSRILTSELMARNYSPEMVKKLINKNFLYGIHIKKRNFVRGTVANSKLVSLKPISFKSYNAIATIEKSAFGKGEYIESSLLTCSRSKDVVTCKAEESLSLHAVKEIIIFTRKKKATISQNNGFKGTFSFVDSITRD